MTYHYYFLKKSDELFVSWDNSFGTREVSGIFFPSIQNFQFLFHGLSDQRKFVSQHVVDHFTKYQFIRKERCATFSFFCFL